MSGEKVLREAVEDHRRELLALQDRHANLAAEYANAKARWEALRQAAQDVVMDAKAHRDRLVEVVRRGQFSTGYAAGMSGPVAALGAALAELEEPAPVEDAFTLTERDKWAWRVGWAAGVESVRGPAVNPSDAPPAPSSAPDREALVCANPYCPHGTEVAALRAEVEEARRSHSIALHEGERFRRERDAAEAALATERARALEENFATAMKCQADCDPEHNDVYRRGWESGCEYVAHRVGRPPPAPAPQGEERCACGCGRVLVDSDPTPYAHPCLPGRAPRAEEGT